MFAWLTVGDEVVVVRCDDFPEYVGRYGVIEGVGDPSKPSAYGVMIEGSIVCFSAHELRRAEKA